MKATPHRALTLIIAAGLLLTALPVSPVTAQSTPHAHPPDAPHELIAEAVAQVTKLAPTSDPRELFAHALKSRGAAVPASDKEKYWRELRAKRELAHSTIHGADSAQSQAVLKVIRPALALYGREWDVAVVEQDKTAVGVSRQCIFIVSTGLLRLITDEELLSFAAHELAHECFIEELREADRLRSERASHLSERAYHLVELKSDLVGALGCLLLGCDPLATATGVARIEGYYLKHDPEVLRGGTHPDAALRRRCIELFLTRINLPGAARRDGK